MASRYPITRAMRLLSSTALRRSGPFVCQQLKQTAQMPRLFTVSARLMEKKYTEDHEWIEMSDDGKTCTLGISEYAAKALGDVVYIELPQTDLEVSEGDAIGAVESVKSASDILTPISGTVVEVNSQLESTPGNINKDPEGDAWIAKITISGQPTGKLLSESEYQEFTEA